MWILPSMSRPQQCQVILDRMVETGLCTEGVVFINGSEHSAAYRELRLPENWTMQWAPENIGALGALNKVFNENPNEEFYGFIGDDEYMRSGGWDGALVDAAGNWDFSHGEDNIHYGTRAQGYLCIGGKLARTVGYLAIPECWHYFGLDDLWEALAGTGVCENICVSTVKVEHRHAYVTGDEKDECYILGESRREIDQQVFFHWLRYKIKDVVERVKEARDDKR